MNSSVEALQVNLACTWGTFQNADKEHSNYFGSRLGKDNVRNAEGRNFYRYTVHFENVKVPFLPTNAPFLKQIKC